MNTIQIIYNSIEELNHDLEENEKLEKSPDTELFGTGDSLDSLQLVHFITILEQNLEDAIGNYIALADERAMSMSESPFKTVQTLAEYIETLLNAKL